MNIQDSFFIRFKEPDVEMPVAEDWRGVELFGGENVFDTEAGYVVDDPDEIREFMESTFGRAETL